MVRKIVLLVVLAIALVLARTFFPHLVSERKFIYILTLIFILIFKISYKVLAIIGLSLLFLMSLFSFAQKLEYLNTLALYSWGFLLMAVGILTWEVLVRRDEK